MSRKRKAETMVAPRYDEVEEEEYVSDENIRLDDAHDSNATDSEQEEADSGSDVEEEQDEHDSELDQSPEPDASDALKDISFGALAKAQDALGSSSRKRKRNDQEAISSEGQRPAKEGVPDKERYATKHVVEGRTSKHAPAVMSTRNPVSRSRVIFSPPPGQKSRDPRFEATVLADASRGNYGAARNSNKNYSFLTDYQATEILDLKAQVKKAKDPTQQAALKRQIMSLEAKVRNSRTRQREEEIRQAHNRQEKDAIRQGKKAKPYFLKDSDIKKQINQERLDGMGKRAKDKADKRKQKREKGKESRDMPRVRRTLPSS